MSLLYKYIAGFTVPNNQTREEYRTGFLKQTTSGPLAGLILHSVDITPNWPDNPVVALTRPPFDIIAELWGDKAQIENWLGEAGKSRSLGCWVRESVEKDSPKSNDEPPRIGLFSLIKPVANLSPSEFRALWDGHVPIAKRVHLAARQYVRHFVDIDQPRLGYECWGFGKIFFKDQHDLEHRMFETPDGVQEVMADTAQFVGERIVIYATEHIKLAPPLICAM